MYKVNGPYLDAPNAGASPEGINSNVKKLDNFSVPSTQPEMHPEFYTLPQENVSANQSSYENPVFQYK